MSAVKSFATSGLKLRTMLTAAVAVGAMSAMASAVTYAPVQIRNAYGFNALPGNVTGAGQTIGIIDFSNAPNIASDLATFNTDFNIVTGGGLTVINQSGSTAAGTAGDVTETTLDVEYAHAIAPGAHIVLIEAPASATVTDDQLTAATNAAISNGATVISMSFGFPGGQDASTEATSDSTRYNRTGVTFVASTGDAGTFNYPASSPYVIGVGGTSLTINNGVNNGFINASGGTYGGETTWNNADGSGGGGVDPNETIPAYQVGILGKASATNRNTPDVSYNADPETGVDIVLNGSAIGGIGGTSAGAPQWAGLIALADQIRVTDGLAPLSSTDALSMLYAAAADPLLYPLLFHDITSGTISSGYAAGTGYDNATGLGSPIANNVVDYLAGTFVVPEPTSFAIVAGVTSMLIARRRRA